MNTSTSPNSAAFPGRGASQGPATALGHGPPRPSVAEAKARLLILGNQADERRAKMIASITSGVIPIVASGAVGVLGGLVAHFFTRKKNKGIKPDSAATTETQAPSHLGGFLSVANIFKVAVWLVPLILRNRAKVSSR